MTPYSKKITKQTGCAENAPIFITAPLHLPNARTATIREPILKFFVKSINLMCEV